MNRSDAIAICRQAVAPFCADPATFDPPEWVIQAVLLAGSGNGPSRPTVKLPNNYRTG